jgi:hypothetical protein
MHHRRRRQIARPAFVGRKTALTYVSPALHQRDAFHQTICIRNQGLYSSILTSQCLRILSRGALLLITKERRRLGLTIR